MMAPVVGGASFTMSSCQAKRGSVSISVTTFVGLRPRRIRGFHFNVWPIRWQPCLIRLSNKNEHIAQVWRVKREIKTEQSAARHDDNGVHLVKSMYHQLLVSRQHH
jgi:hypothetical protein